MTHASVPENERAVLGISDTLIRLSVGLEDAADIIEDLDQALNAAVSIRYCPNSRKNFGLLVKTVFEYGSEDLNLCQFSQSDYSLLDSSLKLTSRRK